MRYTLADCEQPDRPLTREELLRYRKAYGDLRELLCDYKALVERYFCDPLTEESVGRLCDEFYIPTVVSPVKAEKKQKNPYQLKMGKFFSEQQVSSLYDIFVGQEIFEEITQKEVTDFFKGCLKHPLKLNNASKFVFLMHQLSENWLIRSTYQKAIAASEMIVSPKTNTPITQARMSNTLQKVGRCCEGEGLPWKAVIRDSVKCLTDKDGTM